jgi:hypothetical protein
MLSRLKVYLPHVVIFQQLPKQNNRPTSENSPNRQKIAQEAKNHPRDKKSPNSPNPDTLVSGRLMSHFMQCFQFNMHLVESVLENRIIAPDSETRYGYPD